MGIPTQQKQWEHSKGTMRSPRAVTFMFLKFPKVSWLMFSEVVLSQGLDV